MATSLNELARDCKLGIHLFEERVPMRDAVRGACELLGLDPLHIANEGQFLAVVSPEFAHAALAASTYPKLLFAAEPGALVSPAYAEELAGKLKDCRFVKLDDGLHFLQEDHPETMGRSVAAFIAGVERREGKSAA